MARHVLIDVAISEHIVLFLSRFSIVLGNISIGAFCPYSIRNLNPSRYRKHIEFTAGFNANREAFVNYLFFKNFVISSTSSEYHGLKFNTPLCHIENLASMPHRKLSVGIRCSLTIAVMNKHSHFFHDFV